ncbi:uncharacterized protein BP01DRAFT_380763 [Aspergillus saccharolyticus JOP 1030-1]|uniref:Uncharacterized protein n=1 Tax=Aspergillus saccharolyticus JOP 1030-1 TaxID=1450539 RepID=A0A318ZM59_9EURO|nr:hypothetical protein BP01DRAFT_380763 [Aspergillus saccharolyticus JOP 1030-1]PYH47554.1 hypothetical protein BP01DRAFT_380763 [Aspergillus saccharolyticus JOP 1030-1]
MSVSISFGSSSTSETARSDQIQEKDSETYIPQTLVMGIFLAMFATQMAINVIQIRRSRQQDAAEGRPDLNLGHIETRLPIEREAEPGEVDTDPARDEIG